MQSYNVYRKMQNVLSVNFVFFSSSSAKLQHDECGLRMFCVFFHLKTKENALA